MTINQTGRGFKKNRSKNIYKVRQWGGQAPKLSSVSPVDQEIKQAKSNIKDKRQVVRDIIGRKRKRATSQNSNRTPKRRKKHRKKKRTSHRRRKKSHHKKRKGNKRGRKKGKKRGRKHKPKFQDVLS